MSAPLEELARVPYRRVSYGDKEIVLWVGVYQIHPPVSPEGVHSLSTTPDGRDLPIELDGDEGEAELLAKVRRWLFQQA